MVFKKIKDRYISVRKRGKNINMYVTGKNKKKGRLETEKCEAMSISGFLMNDL